MAALLDESSLRDEMDRLLLRHGHLVADAQPAPCTWVIEERTLCWHIVLDDVLEPDIDIEDLRDALVVRAWVRGVLRGALIPVPKSMRATAPRCAYRTSLLEIRFEL